MYAHCALLSIYDEVKGKACFSTTEKIKGISSVRNVPPSASRFWRRSVSSRCGTLGDTVKQMSVSALVTEGKKTSCRRCEGGTRCGCFAAALWKTLLWRTTDPPQGAFTPMWFAGVISTLEWLVWASGITVRGV